MVPKRFIRSGTEDPFGRSNKSAGPSSRITRCVISVTSSSGSTSARTRLSCPCSSKNRTNSCKSAKGISRDDSMSPLAEATRFPLLALTETEFHIRIFHSRNVIYRRRTMSLRINDEAPNFTAETTQGRINFHEWIGDGWAILFSHPKDFTPVCTTELGYMAGLQPEFAKRNCKIIGLSVDPVSSHGKWAGDIEETQGHKVKYPMIGDPQLEVAKLYDMLPAEAGETCEGRTAVNNATVRTVFVVGPDKKVKLRLSYPMTTGRTFYEVLREVSSMQLTA